MERTTHWTETEKAISERRPDSVTEWDQQCLVMRLHKHLLPGLEVRKVNAGVASFDYDYSLYSWEQVKAAIRAEWAHLDGEKDRELGRNSVD
jgi:hypothetical protein